jgi:hypothetical protein
MNIALVLQHKLLLGIQRFMHGSPAPVRPSMAHPVQRPVQGFATSRCAASGSPAAAARQVTRQAATKVMPLRVLRVVETGSPRSSTGRMVISGRMADVCAELDRLVEREAALQTLH